MSTPPTSTTLKLAPYHSKPHPSFFQSLSHYVIHHHRLSDAPIPLTASYQTARNLLAAHTLTENAHHQGFLLQAANQMKAFVQLDQDAFSGVVPEDHSPIASPEKDSTFQNLAQGLLYVAHTHHAYTNTKKTQLLHQHAQQTFFTALNDGSWLTNPSSALCSFLVFAFPDLKLQKCVYWFAFVGVKLNEPITAARVAASTYSEDHTPWWCTSEFYTIYTQFRKAHSPQERSFVLVRNELHIHPLSDWENAFELARNNNTAITLAFNDASFKPDKPSWVLRNFLTAAAVTFKRSHFQVLCIRETPGMGNLSGSILLECYLPREELLNTPVSELEFSYVGWERNLRQKYAPRVAQFAEQSSLQLAENSATLNVQLMKWRMLPELQDKLIANTKCLLLGAGTLGTYVARGLLGWGAFNITLVDRGHVSYSNPVRQPLYEFEDCHNGGKMKAEAAAAALKRIYPKVNAKGVSLNIAMPGHVYDSSEKERVEDEVRQLEQLVQEHDVVFLLMDTRESRWLPTLLGLVHDKIVINSALGFDSYVVMRHGALDMDNPSASRLGCYFCSDVVAPVNSMRDRTLDQQCTVTRPGLAGIAGMMATELLMNLLHHPKKQRAPCTSDMNENPQEHSALGIIPHQIRGSLYGFDTVRMHGRNYSQCIACSEQVIEAYKRDGMSFLHEAFLLPSSLEKLTGLDKLHEEAEERLQRMVDEGVESGEVGDADDFELI